MPLDELHSVFGFSLDQQLAANDVPVFFEDEEDAPSLKAKAREMLAAFTPKVPVPDEVVGIEVPFSIRLTDTDGEWRRSSETAGSRS